MVSCYVTSRAEVIQHVCQGLDSLVRMRLLIKLMVLLTAAGVSRGDTLPTLFLSSLRPASRWASAGRPSPFGVPMQISMKTARFVVVSEGQYDHAHHTHGREENVVKKPHFAATNTSSRVYLGATASLDCTVHDITNESVSWMRRVDDMLELLTWDTHTYAIDKRYSLVQEAGERWQRWQLVVRDVRVEDEGQYRCQVATQPPMVLAVTLSVTVPRARVVDERGTKVLEKHYNSGSMIELKCVIERVPFPPAAVAWRRDATLLSFNTSRGGISVKGDAASGYIRSRLYVREASPADSGVYSCWYGNYTSDTVTVHVIAGENSAAMQHDALPDATPSRGSSPSRPAGLAVYLHLCLLMALYSLASGSSVGARLLGQNGEAPRIPTGDPTSLPACETLLCSGGLQR